MDAGPLPALAFDEFLYDPARDALLGPDRGEIALRPKTMQMLRHLLGHPGRLIPREELLEAIWPGIYVSDDSITQCVGEIRRALGPAGPRLLKTVPKRGYLFDVTVTPRPRTGALEPTTSSEPVDAGAVEPPPSHPALPPPAAPQASDQDRQDEERPGAAVGGGGGSATQPDPPAMEAATRTRLPFWAAGALAGAMVLVVVLAILPLMRTEDVPPPPPQVIEHTLTPSQLEARRLMGEARAVYQSRVYPDAYLAARDLFERAIQADPSYAPAYAASTFTYTNMVLGGYSVTPEADLRIAEERANRAVTLAPDLGDAHAAKGAVLRHQQRFEEALASYRRAVALDPAQIPSLANIGLMLILLGRPAEAFEPIRTAIARRPDSTSILHWNLYLGLAQMQLGTGDFGAAQFRQSLARPVQALLPANARRLHLAAALALSGDIEQAQVIAQEVRQQSPFVTAGWFRERELSGHSTYQEQRRGFYRGLSLAGVPD